MATRWQSIPNPDEDVVKRTAEDIGKVKKRMNVESSGLKGGAKESVREAGGRAAKRLGVRAGLAGAALQSGYDAGRALDESTGVGRKMVEKAGPMIDRAASGERVKLTKEAQRRADEERDFEKMQKGLREADEEGYAKGGKIKGYAKGGKVRGDGICQRGHTKGKMR